VGPSSRPTRTLLSPAGIISTHPDGYTLEVEPEQVDIGRFRAWLREADRAAERGDLDKEAAAPAPGPVRWVQSCWVG
jgi:DNA-binding SARP family transcriptional activator